MRSGRTNAERIVMSTARRSRKRSEVAASLAPELCRTVDDVAREHIATVMKACRGNRTNAARILGIDRKTLVRHLDRWGIDIAPEQRALRPGSLVAIEGIDGSGITTQAQHLVQYLNEHGHRAMYTSEPSTGDVGQLIRHRLASKSLRTDAGTMRTLSLLFAADRTDHFQTVVAPALASGITVVSDRWYHSSLAYQRTTVERDWIIGLHRHTRTPDVTIFLEVRPDIGQARRSAAERTPELFHDLALQQQVVHGYRATIAELRAEGERIEVVDGERAASAVSVTVVRALGLP
jgi:dTMP kinase